MIPEKDTVRISKFLSLVLRHQPEVIGITLDDNGWTSVTILLEKMQQKGEALTTEMLEYIVATNSKKRFAFNEDHTQIRASQGHSVSIDTGYAAQQPPAVLFHGTADRFMPSILSEGLKKMSRQHVHLSADKITAINVGSRHGNPIVLEINTAQMYADGYLFYLSENGVWLTGHVPVQYITMRGH